MSAADAMHPVQLAMFMPARELYNMHSMDSAGFKGDVGAMRASKRRTNAMSKLSDVSEGINKPVQVFHGVTPDTKPYMGDASVAVANGNHRIVAAYDENPDMELPVVHHDQFGDLLQGMRAQDTSGWDA